MSDINCPYCSEEIEINHDDGQGYAEDEIHQQQCPECDKVFVFTTCIHFTYDPCKADCLNDGEHQYAMTHAYPKECRVWRCKDCGEEKKPTAEELERFKTV